MLIYVYMVTIYIFIAIMIITTKPLGYSMILVGYIGIPLLDYSNPQYTGQYNPL